MERAPDAQHKRVAGEGKRLESANDQWREERLEVVRARVRVVKRTLVVQLSEREGQDICRVFRLSYCNRDAVNSPGAYIRVRQSSRIDRYSKQTNSEKSLH